MAYFDNALQQLRNERRQTQVQVERLDSAILVLEGLIGRNTPAQRGIRRGHNLVSADARRRVAAAQRARRARERAQAQSTVGAKVTRTSRQRKLSTAGRKSISPAAKARRARLREKQAH